METNANYVAVGAFVLVCFLGLVAAALWLAGVQYSQQFAYYQTYFTGAVTGLGTGTQVRYNGIDVGRVTHLKFDPDNPKQVIVLMEVDPTLKLHSDSVASIASMGLTGGSFVEIDGGSKDTPILTPEPGNEYPVIASKPSTLQELTNSAPALVAKLNRVGDELSDLLNDKNRKALSDILVNSDKFTTALSSRSDTLTATLDNLNASSAELDSTLKSLHTTIDNANVAVNNVAKLSRDADGLVGADTSRQLSQLLADSRAAVSSLKTLSDTLQNDPKRLIFGSRRKGYAPQ